MHRILVVDDEPSMRKALAMGLSSSDYEVDVADDGTSGILIGAQKDYDVLIADLCLPDMDGLQVIEEIKRTSPEIVPIMITGKGSMKSSIEAIRLNVSDYLEKPISMESIRTSIRLGLEKRASKRKTMRKKLKDMLEIYMEDRSADGASEQLAETIPSLVHQINNPLMCITGSAELAMLKLNDEAAIKNCILRIINATEKITSINKEIIKLGKETDDEIEELHVRDLIEECLNMFKDLLFLKGVTVEAGSEGLDLRVSGNRFKLEQIFKNLILNAIDAMDGRANKRLWITISHDGKKGLVTTHIQDTGCGISSKSLEEIFAPYFTTKKHGTGLGLSVVKGIVEKHNGKIQVESRVGEGTTFTVMLPIAG